MHVSRPIGRRVLAGALVALLGVACQIAPHKSDGPLVDDDAPIFDPRFRGVQPDELDLTEFWSQRAPPESDVAVPLNSRTYADLVESVSDGVVNLYTTVVEEREARVGIDPVDLLPMRIPVVSSVLGFIPFQVPIPFRTDSFSLGSGFLINSEGFILTNAHVVDNATDIRVVRSKQREEFPARIIGIDRATDTALIRIEPQPGMTVLPLGDSNGLDVGELVIAVGNPLGLTHTVTSGMVSAKERIVPGETASLVDYLQTDSAINPGSSGGPLLNLRGEVVGINTAIVSDAQNIGFAIPIDTVKQVMPLLVAGRTERGWFGASVRPLEPSEARERGAANPDAVIVDEVTSGSPAADAGLRKDDLIVRISGEDVRDFISFRRKLLDLRPGQTFELTLSRDGEQFEVSTVLAKSPPR